MINEVSISNYKSILRQRLSLGRVNVFVGRKGSGKTNILEALGIAAAAHDDELDANSLLKRGIMAMKPSLTFHSSPSHKQNKEIEISWHEKNSWKKSKLTCDDKDSWKDISWYDAEYIDKINNLIKFIGDGSIEGLYPFPDESKNAVLNTVFRGSRNFRDYLIYNINTNALLGITNESSKEPLGIYGEGLDRFLSTLGEEQIHEIKTYDHISWTGDAPIPDSLPVLFYLALFIGKRTPSIFAIDNIDGLLEPYLCKDLIQNITKLAAKYNKQAFITTCNPVVVNRNSEYKLFGVKKTEDGQTLVEEMTDKVFVEINYQLNDFN